MSNEAYMYNVLKSTLWLWLWLYTTLRTALHYHRYTADYVGKKPEHIGRVRGFEGMWVGVRA